VLMQQNLKHQSEIKNRCLVRLPMLCRFITDIDTLNEPSMGMLAGYSLSIMFKIKKNNEEI
jgi:hypothetical protein